VDPLLSAVLRGNILSVLLGPPDKHAMAERKHCIEGGQKRIAILDTAKQYVFTTTLREVCLGTILNDGDGPHERSLNISLFQQYVI